ncbi:LPS-assembly lipoprotein [Polynucleobacter meluiroseus]|uniref:LPS-assembly lipoprotein LptE n=1 Tax=Polynucleobacter meluiroseus TaxID=1938814 RepID=A0A240E0Q8_9BURK|nr:LPS assembly lipoprotein LptE [Polynucleobacter meluiroseus]SNX29028.1 LPS-assembly lipoprotein [Polynucleobacter meluiroseus]
MNPLKRRWLLICVLTCASSLLACGYQLRGMVQLPYKAIAITGVPTPPMRADLQTVILTGTNLKIAISPKDADLILEITSDVSGREILAYNSNGQISAYRLNIRVGFRAFDLSGAEVVPESEIYLTRDLDFSNSTVLATDVQQAQFLSQMRKDLSVQILRRVSASAGSLKATRF